MQQLISILPSKHAGACVAAAQATLRNVCLSRMFWAIKKGKRSKQTKQGPVRILSKSLL